MCSSYVCFLKKDPEKTKKNPEKSQKIVKIALNSPEFDIRKSLDTLTRRVYQVGQACMKECQARKNEWFYNEIHIKNNNFALHPTALRHLYYAPEYY